MTHEAEPIDGPPEAVVKVAADAVRDYLDEESRSAFGPWVADYTIDADRLMVSVDGELDLIALTRYALAAAMRHDYDGEHLLLALTTEEERCAP